MRANAPKFYAVSSQDRLSLIHQRPLYFKTMPRTIVEFPVFANYIVCTVEIAADLKKAVSEVPSN